MKILPVLLALSILFSMIVVIPITAFEGIFPAVVKVNNTIDPLGIDLENNIRFGWEITGDGRGQFQSAYQIIVSTDLSKANAGNGDMWDSGKVLSDEQTSIQYEGLDVSSKTKYYVRVKLWDGENIESGWSNTATFETAITDDWQASWISGDNTNLNYLRKEFTTTEGKEISYARAYVTGLGSYVLRLNGEKVGNRYMDPMKTYFDGSPSRVLYSTFDITDMVKTGQNAIGIILESGFLYGGAYKAIAEIDIHYTDGSAPTKILTDGSWKGIAGGAYVEASYTEGEVYDARLEFAGFDMPNFNDSGWSNVQAISTKISLVKNGVFDYVGINVVLTNVDGSAWSDYTLETKFKVKDANSFASVIFRAQDSQNYYMWQISPNVIRPHKMINGSYTLINHTDFSSITTIGLNTWYTMKIECVGSTIKTYIDNVLISTVIDTQFSKGSIGIRQTGTDKMELDYLKVADTNSNELFFDDFNDDIKWNSFSDYQRLVAQKNATIANAIISPTLIASNGSVKRYDIGHNISGFVNLTLTGNSGDTVVITTAENIFKDGTLDRKSYTIPGLSDCRSIDTYILKGSKTEKYEPQFTSHGFRYFEINAPSSVAISKIDVVSISSDIPVAAHFESSDEVVNKLYEGYLWGQRDNTIFFPQGCNNRIERHPWVMDGALTSASAMLYFDAATFYEKWMDDFLDGELPSGFSSAVVPNARGDKDLIWASGAVTVPWDHYMAYGDSSYMSEYYPRLKRYIASLEAWDNGTGIIEDTAEHSSLWTDWLAVDMSTRASTEMYMNLYYYRSVDSVKSMAVALGMTDDASYYQNLMNKIKNSINVKFLKDGKTYDNGTQAINATALAFGIVPEESKSAVAKSLADDIIANDIHFTVGSIGSFTILKALEENGYSDLAYGLATQTAFPSWGYMVSNTPGTYWEHWTGEASLNHPFMGGGVATWSINTVGGIEATEPAYKTVNIRPYVNGINSYASTSLDTIRGTFVNNWVKNNNNLNMQVEIPVNVSANIYIPRPSGNAVITEGSSTLVSADGTITNTADLTYVETLNEYYVFKGGSGSYSFTAQAVDEQWKPLTLLRMLPINAVSTIVGTPVDSWNLPETVEFYLSDYSKMNLPVNWNVSEGLSAGRYNITGEIISSEFNTSAFVPQIAVNILYGKQDKEVIYSDNFNQPINAENYYLSAMSQENNRLKSAPNNHGLVGINKVLGPEKYTVEFDASVTKYSDTDANHMTLYIGLRTPDFTNVTGGTDKGIWFTIKGNQIGMSQGTSWPDIANRMVTSTIALDYTTSRRLIITDNGYTIDISGLDDNGLEINLAYIEVGTNKVTLRKMNGDEISSYSMPSISQSGKVTLWAHFVPYTIDNLTISKYTNAQAPMFSDDETLLFKDDFDKDTIIPKLNDWGSLCTTQNGSGALTGKSLFNYAFATQAAFGGNNSIYRVKTAVKTTSKTFTGATYICMRAPNISGHETNNGIWYAIGLNGEIGVSENNYGDVNGHKMLDYSSIGLNFNNPTGLYFEDDTATNVIKVYADINGSKVLLMTTIISEDGKTVNTYKPFDLQPFSTMDKTANPVGRSGLMIWWTIFANMEWHGVYAYSVSREKIFATTPLLTNTTDKTKVAFDVCNYGESTNISAIVAVYSGKTLVSSSIQPLNLISGKMNSSLLEIPKIDSGSTVRIYFWDNMNGIKPVAKPVVSD